MDLKDNEKDVKIFNKEDFADGEVPENTQRKRWKNTNVISSMEFAITGIWTAFKEERNMRKHTLSGVLALILGVVLQIQEFEWLFLFLTIFLVFMAELFNSAIENVVDLAADYQAGKFSVLDREEYIDLVIRCLEHLDPSIVIHRVTGDGPKDLLIAPLWASRKREVLNLLHHQMKEQGSYQGKAFTQV